MQYNTYLRKASRRVRYTKKVDAVLTNVGQWTHLNTNSNQRTITIHIYI